MKKFKQTFLILLFTLLAAGFTSSAMAASGSDDPWDWGWDWDFSGPWLFCHLEKPDTMRLPPPFGQYCRH
ncbi:hypothetical protein XS74_09885 [Salmonella enterica subsp. enterica]|nr:hypothetical protein [Salmonella enterica subsp. salamae]EAO6408326.1 hypothetical protein [Salmonella enterica]EBW4676937.1 hypothetical protein [Salmonella enterica subsp. salamae serovar Sofia]ECF7066009.1 hypothetical protein [Salmonella enterica subsp. enterica]ECE5742372.1 hypothetical protein [Salmonella enterica subsp. salamae]